MEDVEINEAQHALVIFNGKYLYKFFFTELNIIKYIKLFVASAGHLLLIVLHHPTIPTQPLIASTFVCRSLFNIIVGVRNSHRHRHRQNAQTEQKFILSYEFYLVSFFYWFCFNFLEQPMKKKCKQTL